MRIKVVVQRYGPGVLGGAERLAAVVAALLARHHAVEVLTTTAADYHTWSPAFPPGATTVEGVRVRRFAVDRGRAPGWAEASERLHSGFDSSAFAALPDAVRASFAARVREWSLERQEEFIRGQGPVSRGLLAELARGDFDRVIFVTYLYPTTYDGLLAVDPSRASVIPTLHDEPPAYLPAFGRRMARATLLCCTEAERRLVARLYPEQAPSTRVLGYGLEIPPDHPVATEAEEPFLLYAGRIDAHKGRDELLAWYRALRRCDRDPPRLVLVGESAGSLPGIEGLVDRGFVGEREKLDLMRRALAFVHPSPYESLGIVLLEAMAARTPVLVNARAEVLVDHCRLGRAGLWVRDEAEFVAAFRRLRSTPALRRDLGASGRAYVEREYGLASFERRLLREFPP